MLEFIRRNFRWIAGGFMLTYFSSFGQTYFISASVSEWQAAFGLTHGEFGRIYMFATLASALCLPLVGRLVDVVQAHRMIALVVPVLTGAALLAGYASSLPILVVAVFLLRLFGQGMMTHIALTSTGRWFVAERGRAVSLVVLGHQGGEATIPLAFAALTIAYGYRVGWLAAAVALLVVGLPFAYWCYREPRVPHGQPSMETKTSPEVRSWTRREVLRDPIFWVLLTGVLAPAFIGTTIFYHQNYLTVLHNWPPQFFRYVVAGYGAYHRRLRSDYGCRDRSAWGNLDSALLSATAIGRLFRIGLQRTGNNAVHHDGAARNQLRHSIHALRLAVAGNLRPRQSRSCPLSYRLGGGSGNGRRAWPDRYFDRSRHRPAGANDVFRLLLSFGSGCYDDSVCVLQRRS